jgi:hypothetical protein
MVRGLVVLLALLAAAPAQATRLGAYDYPFVDPLVATVVRTPPANAAALPLLEEGHNLHHFRLRGLVGRAAPPVLFFQRHGLDFALVEQRGPAPLVFVIAGTGGGFDARISLELAAILHAGGYHVITLPNPTHPNFAVNGSTSGTPGRMRSDAADLYRAMQAALARVRGRIEPTAIHLTGYSLGATNAAFVAELDARERALGLDRVLLLNPAVSLFASAGLVDDMLGVHDPADRIEVRRFIERALAAFRRIFAETGRADFSGEGLYRAYAALEPQGEDLERLIGIAFRLSAVNLAFTADVVTGSNFLIPPGQQLTSTSSLTEIYLRAQAYGFLDYFEQLHGPFYERREPGLTPERMIEDADLHVVEDFLASTQRIGLITNEDDIILRPQDLAFLERVFGERAAVYPTGGHCGNYTQRDVAARIQAFFAPTDRGS